VTMSQPASPMNVELINPFITAVFDTMETMVGMTPTREAPYVKDHALPQGDVTGIIGFAEKDVIGSVALSFPIETILKIYNLMMGESESRITREVQDLAGELTNIVAGGAKKQFSQSGVSFHISIPTIVVGRNHTIHHQLNTSVLVIPFHLEKHPFILEVSMKLGRRLAESRAKAAQQPG